jgi:MbtH protein
MSDDDDDSSSSYLVVINGEEQYSIWPEDRDLPRGWARAGFEGSKPDCLEYIDRTWTDMRPRSVRRAMQEHASASAGDPR